MFEQTPDRIQKLDKMRQGVDYRMNASCRGFSFTLRPLTISETLNLAQTVMVEMSKMPQTMRSPTIEHTMMAKKTLVLASTSDVGKFDPQLGEPELDQMTSDEVLFLFKQYNDCLDRCNPMLELMPRKEVEELVAEVKKNGQASVSQLTELSFWQRTSMLYYLLNQND